MGIIIDIILVSIVILSTFLGYKKGLIKLGAGLFAGIIAIILTIVLYTPLSRVIIDNTQLDEKIEEVFMEHAQKIAESKDSSENEKTEIVKKLTESFKNETLPREAKKISTYAVHIATAIIIFVVIKIALSLVISLLNLVSELPILKQFNSAGGIIYGAARGIIVSAILIFAMTMFAKINPENKINKYIEGSLITKIVYENIAKI